MGDPHPLVAAFRFVSKLQILPQGEWVPDLNMKLISCWMFRPVRPMAAVFYRSGHRGYRSAPSVSLRRPIRHPHAPAISTQWMVQGAAAWTVLLQMFRQESLHTQQDGVLILSRAEFIRPRPSRMKNVPHGFLSLMTSLTGVMIAETFDHKVPKRLEGLDQQTLTQWNPDIVHGQKTAKKV